VGPDELHRQPLLLQLPWQIFERHNRQFGAGLRLQFTERIESQIQVGERQV
jgi:hypothetical protein